MKKINFIKVAGYIVCIVGLYFLISFIPEFFDVLIKPMANKSAEFIILFIIFAFVMSGVYLIFTKKVISRSKATYLLLNALVIFICSLIPSTGEEFLTTSAFFTTLALVIYFISFVIIILTSRKDFEIGEV